MKVLLSLMLAMLMTLTPALASLPTGVGTTPAEAAKSDGGLSIPIATTTGEPATLNITRFVEQGGEAVAIGTVTLRNPADGTVAIAPVALNVIRGVQAAVAAQAVCDILHLVLGPLHLDLLGLVIDLNEVHLDIVAVSAPGNLLGNLLCAITGLLDGTGPIGQLVAALNRLIDALNNL
jgi:hypothetical protein